MGRVVPAMPARATDPTTPLRTVRCVSVLSFGFICSILLEPVNRPVQRELKLRAFCRCKRRVFYRLTRPAIWLICSIMYALPCSIALPHGSATCFVVWRMGHTLSLMDTRPQWRMHTNCWMCAQAHAHTVSRGLTRHLRLTSPTRTRNAALTVNATATAAYGTTTSHALSADIDMISAASPLNMSV